MKSIVFICFVLALVFTAAVDAAEQQAIVYLKDQPVSAIARDLHSRAAPRISELEREARSARRQTYSARERGISTVSSEIASTISNTNRAALKLSKSVTAADHEAVARAVQAAGGRVIYRYNIVNALAVSLPEDAVEKIAKLPQVSRVRSARTLTPQLNISVPSLLAPIFWNAGYSGGEWRPAVLDTGVNTSHTGLVHLWTSRVFHEAAQEDPMYADDPNDPNSIHYHGTAVSGPIGCMNSIYQGVSFGVERMMNLKAGYKRSDGTGLMQDLDMMAAIDWAISEWEYPPNVLNFSFAGERGLEDSDLTRYWDSVVDGCLVSSVIAAGNVGGSGNVHDPSIGYNVLCVGAISDGGTTDRSDDVIASFSSWGPTVGGRKKPDIVAPGGRIGSGITLPSASGSYGPGNGTSYAAPHITGSLVLLGNIGISNPMSQKAILLTTAEDKGAPGWDQTFGWGYVDLAAAYTCAAEGNYALDCVAPSGSGDSMKYYRFATASSGKVTLVWNRHVFYNGTEVPDTWYPLNDLDLFLYKESSNGWLDVSESRIDNVEQVSTLNPLYEGVVKVVSHDSAFHAVEREDFAVAANAALEPIDGPSLELEFPSVSFTRGETATMSIKVKNTGGLATHDVKLVISAPMLDLAGGSSRLLGKIAAGGEVVASCEVSAAEAGVYAVSCTAESSSYGETIFADVECDVCVGEKIGFIKLQPDETDVSLVGKTVTAENQAEAWVEESDRSSAIKIIGAEGVSLGDVVSLQGRLGTDCGGRFVVATQPPAISGQMTPPEPVFVSTRDLGGGCFGSHLPGVANGFGLNNLGLLVRIAGEVTESTDTEFYVDDGSALDENLGPRGIKIVSYGLVRPSVGQKVSVTGISSASDEGARGCVRRLLIRAPEDVLEL